MWSTWVWRVDDTAGADSRIWIDGEEQTVLIHNQINLPAPTTTTNAAIGNWNHTTDRIWEGSIACVWAWDRCLDEPEILALSADPYAPVRPGIWLNAASDPVLFGRVRRRWVGA